MPHSELCKLCDKGYMEATGCINEVEYLVVEDEYIDIVFRGTEASGLISKGGWMDVVRDLRAYPWYDKRVGWAHCGFLKGARNIVEEKLRRRLNLRNHKKPVRLAGHSLGAGMSLIAALMLYREGYNVVEWVGFGTPKTFIGYRNLPFKATSYRNGNDLVYLMPPGIIFKYKHSPELTQLESDADSPHEIEEYCKSLEAL